MIPRDNHIANELKEIIPTAEWLGLKPQSGSTPEGYFEQLPEQILLRVRTLAVQEELETLSPLLAGAPKALPFSVSASYFTTLPTQILHKINTQELAELPRITPLSAPAAAYFEQLPHQIMQAVHAADVEEELAELSPLLADIPRHFPMNAPAGYFEQLSGQILQHTTVPVIVRMRPRRNYLQWAVAACLLGLVSTSALLLVKKHTPATTVQEPGLADVSDQEIEDYLKTHLDAFDREELLSFANAAEAAEIEPAALPSTTSELPTEAIQQYLENTGSLKNSPTED